jgi:hypothetical protein
MTSATVPYKVSVRLGQAEFTAEGPESTVREQLTSFLQIASVQPVSPQLPVNHFNGNGHGNGNGKHETPITPAMEKSQGGDTTHNPRLFSEDRDGLISLRILPKTEDRDVDALLLILFGYLTSKKQVEVKAHVLLAAVKQSGLPHISRIDTVLNKYASLVIRGGVKKGSWYALTNPGVHHAEKLAKESFV